jgi:hypothetical protein
MATVPTRSVSEWHLHNGMLGKLSIVFKCPHCRSSLSAATKDVEKPDTCPDCKGVFTFPVETATHVEVMLRAKEAERLEKQLVRLKAQE